MNKRTTKANRKTAPEQIIQTPIASYPPPGHHPSASTILAFHQSPTSIYKPPTKAPPRTKSLSARSTTFQPQQQRGRSAGPSKSATYSIFAQAGSIASNSYSYTPTTESHPPPRGRSSSISKSLSTRAPSPIFNHDDFPQLHLKETRKSSCSPDNDIPYVTASQMRKLVREHNSAAAAKAKAVADLAEARRQCAFYADQEARLSVLAHETFDDELMGEPPRNQALRMGELHRRMPPDPSTRPLLVKARHLIKETRYHPHLPIMLQMYRPLLVLHFRYTLKKEVLRSKKAFRISPVLLFDPPHQVRRRDKRPYSPTRNKPTKLALWMMVQFALGRLRLGCKRVSEIRSTTHPTLRAQMTIQIAFATSKMLMFTIVTWIMTRILLATTLLGPPLLLLGPFIADLTTMVPFLLRDKLRCFLIRNLESNIRPQRQISKPLPGTEVIC